MSEIALLSRIKAILARQGQLFSVGSLSWRLLGVLIVGILVMQIASFIVVVRYKEDDIRGKMMSFMGADVVLAHRLLASVPPSERASWLPDLNRGFYGMSLNERDGRHPLVAPGEFPPLDAVAAKVSKRLGSDSIRWVWVQFDGRSRPILEVPLDSRQVLRLDAEDPLPLPTAWSLAAYMGILLLVASVLSWLAMNLMLLPLHRLNDAAYRLGQTLEGQPIGESGPTELRTTARALNSMRMQLRRQMEDRTLILAAISHDLQTPITRLRLLAELVDDKPHQKNLVENLDAMSQLISEGLEYAKSGQMQVERVLIDLNDLVGSIVAEMCDSGMHVTLEGHVDRRIVGGFSGVRRALQNLVDNAVNYGVSAHIILQEKDDSAIIRIIDRGPGLDPSMQERVFTPFFRIDTSRGRSCGGTGLGLPIARNFIRANGGEISMQNHVSGGLEAVVTLPLQTHASGS